MVDIDLPSQVWEPWIEPGQPKKLRRALAVSERAALEARRDELAPWVGGYHAAELDDVSLALIDMFTGFPSMAATGAEAGAAKIDAVARLLSEFPAWSIILVCDHIRTHGYVRDGKNERHWPPSDPELFGMVKEKIRHYVTAHDTAVALLKAKVA